jgi:hypothetical protein
VRARIAEPVGALGIQLDCIASSRDVDAIPHRHLELPLEHEAELITLVVQRRGGAGRARLISAATTLNRSLLTIARPEPDTCIISLRK